VLLAALAAAGLVAAIVVILAAVLTRSGSGQGPLEVKIRGRLGIGQPAAVGQAISASGPLVVQNTGDQALVLDRVELVGLRSGIYRGAYVLPWPPNKTPFSGALSYHVPRNGRAMPGVTVAPHALAWIVIGLTARRGRHQWTRVDIVYHDRDATYRRRAALSGAVCGSPERYRAPCDPPGFAEPR
jgi:hypothetical protein